MNKRKIISIFAILLGIIFVIVGISISLRKPSKAKEEKNISATNPMYNLIGKVDTIEKSFLDKLPVTNISEISNQDKLGFVSTILNQNSKQSYSEKEIERILKEYFGDNVIYKNEDIKDKNKIIYKYNSNTHNYYYQESSNFSKDYDFITLTNEEEKSNQYIIRRKYLFMDNISNKYHLYSNINDYQNKKNEIGVYIQEDNRFDSRIIRDYQNMLPEVVYIFAKEKNNYVLKSINVENK